MILCDVLYNMAESCMRQENKCNVNENKNRIISYFYGSCWLKPFKKNIVETTGQERMSGCINKLQSNPSGTNFKALAAVCTTKYPHHVCGGKHRLFLKPGSSLSTIPVGREGNKVPPPCLWGETQIVLKAGQPSDTNTHWTCWPRKPEHNIQEGAPNEQGRLHNIGGVGDRKR